MKRFRGSSSRWGLAEGMVRTAHSNAYLIRGEDQTVQVWKVATERNIIAWQEDEKESEDRQAVLRHELAASAEHRG